MYPNADVPALQLSLDKRRGCKQHLDLGREISVLARARSSGAGQRQHRHSLRRIDWNNPSVAYDWAVAFDGRVKQAVEAHDADSLAAPQKWGEALLETAHPTVEPHLPLLYCMGSTDGRDAVSYPYEGFDFGSISMRMILFGQLKGAE